MTECLDYFEKEEDIIPFCKKQLEICGVEYFDYYLMHAQSRGNYDHFKKCHAYETAFKLKEMGLVKHVGLSFHDSPEFLDKILNEYPDVEVVQIQFNYLDYDNPNVQSKGVYDVCRKHNKPILVMEPVKGGTLANLPLDAKKIVDSLNVSPASLAIRYAASFEGMIRVLSGMSSLEQMKDNISFMKEFKKIDKNEEKVISKVVEKLKDTNSIPCTGCAYCTNNCPIGVPIPEIFKLYNSKKLYNNWGVKEKYEELIKSKCDPKDCLHCGACESACPQKLEIRELLEKVSKEFE